MKCHRFSPPAATRVLLMVFWSLLLCGLASPRGVAAAQPRLGIQAAASAHLPTAYGPGDAIALIATQPATRQPVCAGLASLRDPYGIPMSLGRLRAVGHGLLHLLTHLPTRVLPAEPAGPFLVYIGTCATPAPMGEFAHIVINIQPH